MPMSATNKTRHAIIRPHAQRNKHTPPVGLGVGRGGIGGPVLAGTVVGTAPDTAEIAADTADAAAAIADAASVM